MTITHSQAQIRAFNERLREMPLQLPPAPTKPRIVKSGGFWHVDIKPLTWDELFPKTPEQRARVRLIEAAATWCRLRNAGLERARTVRNWQEAERRIGA